MSQLGFSQRAPQRRPDPDRRLPTAEMSESGTLCWYDKKRRYGFINTTDGQVFIHWMLLERYGVKEDKLYPGVRVRFKAKPHPMLRPEAIALAIVA